LGFEGSLDTGIGRLSKGNTRKLALIQALLSPPRLLVLDEPFAGLDQATAASVNELLKDEVGNGGAVILCDHERRAAVPVDQHAELAGGRLHRREPADAGTPRPRTTAVVRLDPAGRRPRPELPVLEGILRIDAIESDVVSAWVEREHTDAFLAAALAAGWSVRSVRDDSGA
jgi:ABC-type multidrug transport system ATPase subunit